MPPLLIVNVRKAKLAGPAIFDSTKNSPVQFNTYVLLKLHNLTINTLPVKGLNPSWEQNFLFQTAGHETGLLVELWNKGSLWNKLLGCVWITLDSVIYRPTAEQQSEEGALAGNPDGYLQGTWYFLDTDVLYDDRNRILGTARSTEHMLLISCHFEPSISELGVDQYHFGVQQNPQLPQASSSTTADGSTTILNGCADQNATSNHQLTVPAGRTPSSQQASPQNRLRSPYLINPQTPALTQLAQLAVAEADRTGSSPTVATISTMPTTNLYKPVPNPQQLLDHLIVSSSENELNERTDQNDKLITSTESDSQEEERLEEFASRLRSKRGISLLDELIMANNATAEMLVDQLCALDEQESDTLDEQVDSSEDDLLLLDGEYKIFSLKNFFEASSVFHKTIYAFSLNLTPEFYPQASRYVTWSSCFGWSASNT